MDGVPSQTRRTSKQLEGVTNAPQGDHPLRAHPPRDRSLTGTSFFTTYEGLATSEPLMRH